MIMYNKITFNKSLNNSKISLKKNKIEIEDVILKRCKKNRIRTQRGDFALLNHLKSFYGDNLYINTINAKFCVEFTSYLIDNVKIKVNSAKTYLQKLHAILEYALSLDYIEVNPMPPLNKLLPKYIAKEKEYLTIDEIQTLQKSTCRHEISKLAFLFACYTGLRLSDVETLKWDNIHKHGNYLMITKIQIKTNNEVRIPLSRHAIEILDYIKMKNYSNNNIIFDMYSRSTTYKDLNELAINAKLKKHITFHVSRISFVTLSVSAGISIFVISKLCGHTNIKTTQIYTRMTDMTYINAIKSLDNLFS